MAPCEDCQAATKTEGKAIRSTKFRPVDSMVRSLQLVQVKAQYKRNNPTVTDADLVKGADTEGDNSE
jgi:hypothetical protein